MSSTPRLTDEEEEALRAQLAELREEHRALDIALDAANESGGDQLLWTRLKKRKLQLKDQITKIENTLLPDIIA